MPLHDNFGQVLGTNGRLKIIIRNDYGVAQAATVGADSTLTGTLPTNGQVTGWVTMPNGVLINAGTFVDANFTTTVPGAAYQLSLQRVIFAGVVTANLVLYDTLTAAVGTQIVMKMLGGGAGVIQDWQCSMQLNRGLYLTLDQGSWVTLVLS